MKELTTSTFTFSKLIEGGCLYVDKTRWIHDLIRPVSAQYFLSRPRRFGKSLLISTLKAVFQGRRDLFKGFWLDAADYDWQTFPVIHLDMGSCSAESKAETEHLMIYELDRQAQGHGLQLTQSGATLRFRELIDRLSEKGRVVILVDEYDKPLLGHLGKPEVLEIQSLLKAFYGVIKTTEAQQRFALLTGVSKVSKVSIFSDLNNLTDLTMRAQSAVLLGYTQEELENNFAEHIDALARKLGQSRAQTLEALKRWYNGYRFHQDSPTVYNPVSVMKCFQELEFRNHWFETGTPSFLVELLRGKPVDLGDLSAPETAFSAYEPDCLEPLPLLVQTGYLTILDARQRGDIRNYQLGFPNQEIELSFNYWLAQGFSCLPAPDLSSGLDRLMTSLEKNDPDEMLETLKIFFSQVPNTITIRQEKYYQTIFFTVFTMIGAMTEAEVSTNTGRIDAVVKTADRIFIFEFKLDGTANDALRQIREKRYDQPYRADGRPLTLIGVAFGAEERNLTEWEIAAGP